jgi:RNA polymerase sigma-70 factor (ECF subfamily)
MRPRPAAVRDDDRIMERIARRDAAAFTQVVGAQASRLQGIAWRMTGDPVEAEDVAQEALLRLWNQARSWQPGKAGIGAWLARVAVNLCLDRLRRRRFASDAPVPERADDSAPADAQLDADRLRARALAALASLSDRHRAAIVLTYYEEMPNAAAAAALDMQLKGFESLLLRARNAMRAALAESGLVTLAGEPMA